MKVPALRARVLMLTLAMAAAPGTGIASRQAGRAGAPAVNPQAAALADFQKRAAEYVAQRKKLESSLPPLGAQPTPDLIAAHERELASRIAAARVAARPGDVFTAAVRPVLRGLLNDLFAGPDGGSLRATIGDDQPVASAMRINTRYPDGQPVSTVPLVILKALPPLPDGLEYRFVGSRLLLLDAQTQVIVDYMDQALPKGGGS